MSQRTTTKKYNKRSRNDIQKLNSWEICHRCAKMLPAAEHKMQLAYYLRSTDWFQSARNLVSLTSQL